MGGKKRKKGVSTDTSGTDLDSSDTAVKRQDMEVSGAIFDRLKAMEEKLEDNESVLSAKIVVEIGKLRSEIFDLKK